MLLRLRMKNFLPILIICCIATSCTKDRFPLDPFDKTVDTLSSDYKSLKINEFCARGVSFVNEFGMASDWIELYNTSNYSIIVKKGELFVTDDFGNKKDKYALPNMTIGPKAFILVWCDNRDTVKTQIHSNFSLSSNGESLGLVSKINGNITDIDFYDYGIKVVDDQSEGRLPDGGQVWTIFSQATPGGPN